MKFDMEYTYTLSTSRTHTYPIMIDSYKIKNLVRSGCLYVDDIAF